VYDRFEFAGVLLLFEDLRQEAGVQMNNDGQRNSEENTSEER